MSSRGYGSRSPFQTGSGNSVTLTAGSGLSSVGSILSVNVGNALSINSVGNKVDVNIADGLYVSNTNKICTLSSAECGSGPIKNNGAGASGYSICVFVAGSVSAFPYSVNYQNWPGSWPSSGQSITVVNGGIYTCSGYIYHGIASYVTPEDGFVLTSDSNSPVFSGVGSNVVFAQHANDSTNPVYFTNPASFAWNGVFRATSTSVYMWNKNCSSNPAVNNGNVSFVRLF